MKKYPLALIGLIALAAIAVFIYLQLNTSEEADTAPDRSFVELLVVGDPFARSMQNKIDPIRDELGMPLRLSVRRYNRTHETILSNHQDHDSYFHLVSFDILWLPELAEKGILKPLSLEELREFGFDPEDHHQVTLDLNTHQGKLYGLPIQPHPELLWYRRDLLEKQDLTPPRDTMELLDLAARFHKPDEGFYGIGWNGLRGQALGQTITHLYAAFGSPVVDSEGEVFIASEAGKALSDFLLELADNSPPDILSMAWDQRIERFTRGQTAFTYGWMARNQAAERHALSEVQGKVGYLLPPATPGHSPAVPMGQWSLGIPANISAEERERALQTLVHLLSDEVDEILFADGFHGHHRSRGTVIEKKKETDPGYLIVHELLETGNIHLGARPMIPQWAELADILGVAFHDMLRGDTTPEEALQLAQEKAKALLKDGKESNP